MWIAIYLCCLMVVGFGAVTRLIGSRSWIEIVGLAACLGPGIVGLILIALSMFGYPPRPDLIFVIAILFGIAGVFTPRTQSIHDPGPGIRPSPQNKLWIALCLIVITYGIFAVAVDALGYPSLEWDAYGIWQFKAKVLTLHALFPRPDYFSDVTLSFSHLRYPILAPMISAGMFSMIGQLDDQSGKIPSLLMFLGLGAVIFGAVKSYRGPLAAAAAAAFLLTTPAMLAYAGCGTAEMALTAFYGCSIVCILRWQQKHYLGDLVLALIFTACMAWTKNEGIAMAAINCVVIFALNPKPLSKRNLLTGCGFALLVFLLYLPWIIYTHNLPRTDENYSQRLNITQLASHLSRLPTILHEMLYDTIQWRHWGLFWLIPVATAILMGRRIAARPILTLWILLLLQLLAYIPPYLVADWNLQELLWLTVSRLLLHASPAAALLIGLQWPSLQGE